MSGNKRQNRQEGGEEFKELQRQIGVVLHYMLSGLLMIRNPSPPDGASKGGCNDIEPMQENFVTDQIIVDKKVPFPTITAKCC